MLKCALQLTPSCGVILDNPLPCASVSLSVNQRSQGRKVVDLKYLVKCLGTVSAVWPAVLSGHQMPVCWGGRTGMDRHRTD